MLINGIPLHPLVVHAAVVFVPLAAVSTAVFALVPKWRWILRTPSLVVAVVAALSTQLAAMTGEDLQSRLGRVGQLMANHEAWAGRMQFAAWVLAGVALVAWWALPYATPLAGRADREAPRRSLVLPVVVALPLLAFIVAFFAYRTGDAGAQLVWASTAR